MTGPNPERWAAAVERLRAGGAVMVTDEAHEGTAVLVATQASVLDDLSPYGRGPLRSIQRAMPLGDADRQADAVSSTPRAGGTLTHPGLDEAAHDLAEAAAGRGAFVLAAALQGGILSDDGEAERLARRLDLPTVSVQDVVAHRLAIEPVVEHVAVAHVPSIYTDEPLETHAFRSLSDGLEHLVLVRRPPGLDALGPEPLVRLHSECLTGDALGSLRCDCGDQLRGALQQIGEDPQGGAVVYLRGHEGRGIGLANKIRAYALQEQGLDTVEANAELGFDADMRDYGTAVQMLRWLGIDRLKLLSNNPRKAAALERYGIVVADRRSLRIGPNPYNASYLETKRLKLGHDLAERRSPSKP